MAKPHVATYLDQLISADIDTLASTWIAKVEAQLGDLGDYQHGFGVADDVAGGWTERSASEMCQRVAPPFQHWLTTVLFASDPCAIPHIHGLLRATCYRHYHQTQHGIPTNLATMLAQEQGALRFGNIFPPLLLADLADTDHIISPYLAATDYPTQIAVLWGDEVARHNGFPPLGFSRNAGLA